MAKPFAKPFTKPSAMSVAAGCAGLVAGTLAFGAVQFALGDDLTFGARGAAAQQHAAQQHSVNREAKADRLAPAAQSSGTTLSFRTPRVPDTLIVTRIPAAQDKAVKQENALKPDNTSLRSTVRSKPIKRTVACEPSVSVLAEVAKLLDSSRCIT